LALTPLLLLPSAAVSPGAAAEDDGWVLVTVHDAVSDKGKLVILDAQRLSQGPVATLHLPHFLPAGLHGSWCDQVFGAEETGGAAPKWKPPVAIRPL
jgi:all-trans-8'-apo-beta-carotenal 15,15'-oxygenase